MLYLECNCRDRRRSLSIGSRRKNIQRRTKTCNWARLTINKRMEVLSNTLIGMFRNYIPYKSVLQEISAILVKIGWSLISGKETGH